MLFATAWQQAELLARACACIKRSVYAHEAAPQVIEFVNYRFAAAPRRLSGVAYRADDTKHLKPRTVFDASATELNAASPTWRFRYVGVDSALRRSSRATGW